MATYDHPKYNISVEVSDDATPEELSLQLREAERAHIQKQKEAGQARSRPEGQPAGPVTPEGQSVAQRAVSAIRERLSEAASGAMAGGFAGGPLGAIAGGVAGGAGRLPDWMTGAGEVATGAAPSIAGALAGRAVGSRVAGPAGGMLGGAAGSLGGEYLAQTLGLAPESGLGLAAAALPIPASATARTVVKGLPGAAKGIRAAAAPLWEGAETLATQLGLRVPPKEVAKAAAKLAPEATLEFATSGMKRLIKQATLLGEYGAKEAAAARKALNEAVSKIRALKELRKAPAVGEAAKAEKLVKTKAGLAEAKKARDVVIEVSEAATEKAGGVPFKRFRTSKTVLGARKEALERTRGPELGEAKTLYGAMSEDMNAVIATAPPELKSLLTRATQLTKEAARSQKVAGPTTAAGPTGVMTRMAIGGGGFLFGGPLGALAYVAPKVIRAGLESKRGVQIIKTMAEQGSNIDQIANALVQAGIGAATLPDEQDQAIGMTP